jgi:hypothetical protein
MPCRAAYRAPGRTVRPRELRWGRPSAVRRIYSAAPLNSAVAIRVSRRFQSRERWACWEWAWWGWRGFCGENPGLSGICLRKKASPDPARPFPCVPSRVRQPEGESPFDNRRVVPKGLPGNGLNRLLATHDAEPSRFTPRSTRRTEKKTFIAGLESPLFHARRRLFPD